MPRKPEKARSFGNLYPELAKEWHPTKNGNLTPFDFTRGSEKKVWWKCDKGNDHEWEARIYGRSNGTGCPKCSNTNRIVRVSNENNLNDNYPNLSNEWHPTKNGELTPNDVRIKSRLKVWWKCDKGNDHEWESRIDHRVNGSGCPICSNKKVVLSNCLATKNPEIAKEWHPTKNGDLTPNNVVPKSGKQVWWKCDKGDDHEWITSIDHRTIRNTGCPYCSNNKVSKSNNLLITNPNIASMWHPTKNGDLKPEFFLSGSSEEVWWRCPLGEDHVYKKKINQNVKYGCSVCSNTMIVNSNRLSNTHPFLASQWHPTLNGSLSPDECSIHTDVFVWWKCQKGDDHIWKTRIPSRKKTNCPFCANINVSITNNLEKMYPDIAKDWHPRKNGKLKPKDVISGTSKKVWWKCNKGDDHEWEATVSSRTLGNGCPICSGYTVVQSNCIATTHPELSKQWHSPLNGNLTPEVVSAGSNKKVWWKCDKGDDHIWESSIYNRAKKGSGCSICRGFKVVKSNCLATTHPELAKQWHSRLNGELTPNDVTSGFNKKVWWKCDKGDDHIWESTIGNRAKGKGCAVCSNRLIVASNSIATTHPDLAKELHPTLNGQKTQNDIGAGSHKKVWWKCPEGDDHIWEAPPYQRVASSGCPICRNIRVVKSNSIATTHPTLAKQWHPTLNGDLTPNDIVVGTPKKFWWKCDKGDDHIWEASPHLRSKDNTGCPFCTLTPQSRQELIITFELKQFFDINPKGFKTRVNGKLWSIDIYIPLLNLGIEFDGAYWHKDKVDFDKLKTQQLNENGFNIIRVRQSPLKRIFENDILTSEKFNGKAIANKILKQILNSYRLEEQIITKIEAYLALDSLQNEIELNNYIEGILMEKSKRKTNI